MSCILVTESVLKSASKGNFCVVMCKESEQGASCREKSKLITVLSRILHLKHYILRILDL